MKFHWRMLSATLLAGAVLGSSAACYSASKPAARTPTVASAAFCQQQLDGAINNHRLGGPLDELLQSLTENCPNEYDIAIGYVSNAWKSAYPSSTCEELIGYGIRPESVRLLSQDGWCESGSSSSASKQEWPENGLGWDKARTKVGKTQRVCGPIKSVRVTEHGTFVNVGRDYPSRERFTFVLWDIALKPIKKETIACAKGKISLYEGVTQMELKKASALKLWR